MECLVLTCLGSAPFLAVLTYELDPVTDLRACSKPCCFIRVSATETLPESIAANLQDLPTFVGVENDRNFSVAPPKAKVDWHGITLITQIHPASLGWISSETKEFPTRMSTSWYAKQNTSGRRLRIVRTRLGPSSTFFPCYVDYDENGS
jgi:hypothetical protein